MGRSKWSSNKGMYFVTIFGHNLVWGYGTFSFIFVSIWLQSSFLCSLLSISSKQSLQQGHPSFPLLPNNIHFYRKILILFSLWFSFIIHASINSSHMLVNSSCMHLSFFTYFHFLIIIFFLDNFFFSHISSAKVYSSQIWLCSSRDSYMVFNLCVSKFVILIFFNNVSFLNILFQFCFCFSSFFWLFIVLLSIPHGYQKVVGHIGNDYSPHWKMIYP
jgi:hypothetical protein